MCGRLNRAASQRPAIAIPTLLPQPWPRGRVVASTPAVWPYFGMARAPAAELAELPDVVEGDGRAMALRVLDTGEVQERVEEHRGMAVREHEAIAVGPRRVVGIEPQ